ncbi:hypothetical protein [Streptomyces marianii]|uniref:hypothetical protein n=1 Tax=Streptomyces marianii TaxID=1817406 RepID=UPI001F1DC378|nr:hypothetical protein [Streptomyces marianii]
MTSSLDREDHIAKLRIHRPSVPDAEVYEVLAALDASGLVSEVEPLVAQSTGRNRTLTVRALFLGMWLAAARNSGTVTLTAVANLLFFGLSDKVREQLGISRYADHYRGFEAGYHVVRRLFHRIKSAVDPSPVPKNHRLDRELVARLFSEADLDELAGKHSLMVRVANRITVMSLLDAHPLLEGRWNGSVALDATVIGTYAKGMSANSPVTASDPDAGWYVRTAKHKDPLVTDAPPQERVKKRLYGYDACLVVARDPSHDGAPLPDGSANLGVVPSLIVAFSLDKPSHRPAEVALEALQHDPRYPRRYLAGDRLYPDEKPDKSQPPIRALGYQPVYDYAKDQLGVQAQFAGAELIEGNWYRPSMPQSLKDATKDLVVNKIDKQTWINRIRQHTIYPFLPKQRADAEGHRRMMCPAEANRGQCSLKPYTLGRGIHLPLIDLAPAPPAHPSPAPSAPSPSRPRPAPSSGSPSSTAPRNGSASTSGSATPSRA